MRLSTSLKSYTTQNVLQTNLKILHLPLHEFLDTMQAKNVALVYMSSSVNIES